AALPPSRRGLTSECPSSRRRKRGRSEFFRTALEAAHCQMKRFKRSRNIDRDWLMRLMKETYYRVSREIF
ncbi:hypothetical protein, partial [Salmonella enterica]|uniref:hypothetical protein n=1 Tax=Salmonella enterica TaxID=28901 RepID=UPI003CE67AB4